MILIIGLGNPGEKFKNTRHNAGFAALDRFAEKNDFPEFKLSKKYDSLISEKTIDEPFGAAQGKKIILAKPQTFMNESGKAAKHLPKPSTSPGLVVVHDDMDLLLGKIKIAKKRGSAGHKGVESIIKELKTNNFIRLRIGITPEQTRGPVHGSKKAEDFVLEKFTKEERQIINEAIDQSAEALDFLLRNGLEKAMNKYN